MRHIFLISCGKAKLPHPAPAAELYTGTLFKFSLAYARRSRPDRVFILSAKYGLVPLTRRIAPYEQTLTRMSQEERARWAAMVMRQLRHHCDPINDHFTILAGSAYAAPLLAHLRHHALPLKGLGQGKRLRFLKAANVKNSRQPKLS